MNKKHAFVLICLFATTAQAATAPDFNALLTRIRPYVTTARYQQLSQRCQRLVLTIATMSPEEQEALFTRLSHALSTEHEVRSHALLDSIEQEAETKSFTYKNFMFIQQPLNYLGAQLGQLSHLSPVYRVLGIIGFCSAVYLSIKALKNMAARKELGTHLAPSFEADRKMVASLSSLTDALAHKHERNRR